MLSVMVPVQAQTDVKDVRGQILEAAEQRFRTYGYRKTTMAEIAEDTRMSAANLYRYFDSKEDIAASCAQHCMGERLELLRQVIRAPGVAAVERLERFALTMLHYTYEQTHNQRKINELIESVAVERPGILHEKNEAERALIAEILAQGNSSGEFDVQDIIATAQLVHASLALFSVPVFMPLYPLEELERGARGVISLLVRGLARR
jgi:AcrR family transcriptional regulator